MDKLINRLKDIRKRSYLDKSCKFQYAFVGIGNHSINNLYPVINYLKVDLKYIITRSAGNAKLINDNFMHSEGTNDLKKVLDDEHIKGVFVCASPKSHFGLVKEILLANKNVFVEKPPCFTYEELQDLIECEKSSEGKCFVGLQKCFAPANVAVKRKLKGKVCYNYRYVTGAYPEGDPFLDLFIHPISLISYLFGDAVVKYKAVNKSNSGITVYLHMYHSNGSNGIVELSTDYSWANALEELIINTEKGVFKIDNSEDLSFQPKQGTICNIPKEKIFGGKMTAVTLKKRNNFNPVFNNNQLYTCGYYDEIENFVHYCESGKYKNSVSLEDCLNIYEILKEL